MTQTDPAIFKGKATCTDFDLGGTTTVSACYNLTDDKYNTIASGCTEPVADERISRINHRVALNSDQLDTTYYITVTPLVPGRHMATVEFNCLPAVVRQQQGSASGLTFSFLFVVLAALLAVLI
jgi:hypothetical protein